MIRIRRFALAAVGTVVFAAACTSISIPSIPPIDVPSFALPSGIVLPTADANSGACVLITPAEVSAIMGATVTVTESDSNSCTYTLPNFSAVVVTTSTDTDLTGVRFLFGDSARDTNIGGFPAVSGVAIGQPAVYVQKPTGQLSVLGVLTGSDDAAVARVVQIATTAVARWP